jgi:hypothetical protein
LALKLGLWFLWAWGVVIAFSMVDTGCESGIPVSCSVANVAKRNGKSETIQFNFLT